MVQYDNECAVVPALRAAVPEPVAIYSNVLPFLWSELYFFCVIRSYCNLVKYPRQSASIKSLHTLFKVRNNPSP